MADDIQIKNRWKTTVSITLSPYLIEKINRVVNKEKKFSSVSDFASMAFSEFLLKCEAEEIKA